jgi:hypothetical protein
MFKDLMHNILGSTITTSTPGVTPKMIGVQRPMPTSKKLFYGTVEVLQVANGYIVNIGRKEGYEYETYIAETITDVNERIAAAIVAFQLES